MSKHLVIGLGGTGLKISRALRCILSDEVKTRYVTNNDGRRVKQYYKTSIDQDNKVRDNIYDFDIRYLEVDSSHTDLQANFEGYLTSSGDNLKLGDAYWLNIGTAGVNGAEQIRRVGSQMFATFANDFDRKVLSISNEMGAVNGLNIHICAGLAGGTGSGCIVDAVARIRQLFPHTNGTSESPVSIYLYLYLPEENSPWRITYYEPNGYSALRELSAMNTRNWTPVDKSTTEGKPYTFEQQVVTKHEKKHRVFKSAYLLENVNERHCNLPVSGPVTPRKDQVAQFMGQFLYFKMIGLTEIEDAPSGEFRRADSNENIGLWLRETSFDLPEGTAEADQQPYYIHDCGFNILGVKKISVPITEMKLHWASVMAKEFVLQFFYNEVSTGGYLDPESEDSGLDPETRKRQLEQSEQVAINTQRTHILNNLKKLKLENSYLRYEDEVEKGNETNIKISDRWLNAANDIDAAYEKLSWIDRITAFRTAMQAIYEKEYNDKPGQQAGVDTYYKERNQNQSLKTRAGEHVRLWENELMLRALGNTTLNENTIGIRDLFFYQSAMLAYLDSELKTRIAKELEASLKEEKNLSEQCDEAFDRFLQRGFLLPKAGVYTQYKELLQRYYVQRTNVRAIEYAQQYVQALIQAIINWGEELSYLKDNCIKALRGVYDQNGRNTTPGVINDIKGTCPPNYNLEEAINTHVRAKVYDTNDINLFDNELKKEENRKDYIESIRQSLLNDIIAQNQDVSSGNLSLRHLLPNINASFKQKLISLCLEELEKPGGKLQRSMPNFDVNTIIKKKYPEAEHQHTLAQKINDTSFYFASLDQNEMQETYGSNQPLNRIGRVPETQFAIIPQKHVESVADLENSLVVSIGGARVTKTNKQCSEITVIRLRNGLPARALKRVRALKEAYRGYELVKQALSDLYSDPHGAKTMDLFFPNVNIIQKTYIGINDDHKDYAGLRESYLLGEITRQPDAHNSARYNWVYMSKEKSVLSIPEILCPSTTKCFFDEELRPYAVDRVAREHKAQNLGSIFEFMRKTRKKWDALVEPSHITTEIKEERDAALARLEEALKITYDLYPNPTCVERTNIINLYNYYKPILSY